MLNRRSFQNGYSQILIIALVILTLLSVLGFLAWSTLYNNDQTSTIHPVEDNAIQAINGPVSMIIKSCQATSLDPNENTSAYSVCDGGEALRINDRIIRTSSGGPKSTFNVDISSVKLGDRISAHYIIDEETGEASLNCSECAIHPDSPAKP